MSNIDINVDRRTDGRTDGQKIECLYRTLLQAGAIKIGHSLLQNPKNVNKVMLAAVTNYVSSIYLGCKLCDHLKKGSRNTFEHNLKYQSMQKKSGNI